jgi:ABC-2 type transport system ATP-binding protein
MVQRMGIAQALINDPDLVVLDEPMSGLDPMGRKDVRDIIVDLRDQGKTVFFSSHILQDVELICDRVSFMIRGQMRHVGSLGELIDAHTSAVEIIVTDASHDAHARLATLATDAGEVSPGKLRFTLGAEEVVAPFVQAVLNEGATLVSVTPLKASLEDIFVETARQEGDA